MKWIVIFIVWIGLAIVIARFCAVTTIMEEMYRESRARQHKQGLLRCV